VYFAVNALQIVASNKDSALALPAI